MLACKENLKNIETVRFQTQALSDVEYSPAHQPVYVLTNPPYDHRLQRDTDMASTDQLIHSLVEKFNPKAIGLVRKHSSSKISLKNLPFQRMNQSVFNNNGIKVDFIVFDEKIG